MEEGGVVNEIDIQGQTEPLNLGRALSLETQASPDPHVLTKSIIRHNIGHCFWLSGAQGHSRGTYEWSGPAGQVSDVTPMATTYVRAGAPLGISYASDTEFKGGGDVPDNFNDKDNWIGNAYCGATTSWCRHTHDYSEEAKDEIVSNNVCKICNN